MNGSFRFKESELGYFNTKHSDDVVVDLGNKKTIMGLTMGNFSLIDLIKSILDKVGKSDIYIATWSAGIKDVHQVKWMRDSNLINRMYLLTDISYVNRQKKYACAIETLFGKENLRTSKMHAKFVLIENFDFKITIVSSMNLNSNKTCETFAIYEDSDVFDFYKKFVVNHFEDLPDGFDPCFTYVNKSLEKFFIENEKEKEGSRTRKTQGKESNPAKHWSEL